MKKIIQKIFHFFGFQLTRLTKSPIACFSLQKNLIRVKNPIIFDVGAHVGSVAKIYREEFPLASIYCFEPFQESFENLSENLKDDPCSFYYPVAISEEHGTAFLNSNCNSATNSLLKTDVRGASYWGVGLLETMTQTDVSTTTIDIFCREQNISHIDILKMDVQGAEFYALKGAQEMLSSQRISLIYTELIICATYDGQHKFHEYLSFLDSFGYEFLDFFNPVRKNNQLLQTDAIFLSSSFKQENSKY